MRVRRDHGPGMRLGARSAEGRESRMASGRTSKRTPRRRVKWVNFSMHFCTHCRQCRCTNETECHIRSGGQFLFCRRRIVDSFQTTCVATETMLYCATHPLLSSVEILPPECLHARPEALLDHEVHRLHAVVFVSRGHPLIFIRMEGIVARGSMCVKIR